MKRIAVLGTSCSGKTRFSKQLSQTLGFPHIELDALHWGENWNIRDEFRSDVTSHSQKDTWIMDGNYGEAMGPVLKRATTVIILDLPFYLVFYRALYRTARRAITKERLFNNNRESFGGAFFSGSGIPFWVIKTFGKRRRQSRQLETMDRYAHIDFIRLESRRRVDAFLAAPGRA